MLNLIQDDKITVKNLDINYHSENYHISEPVPKEINVHGFMYINNMYIHRLWVAISHRTVPQYYLDIPIHS